MMSPCRSFRVFTLHPNLLSVAVLALALAPPGAVVRAGVEQAPVSFHNDVRPILVERCQGCHQPAKALGKFVLTSYALLMEGSKSDDPIVVAGKPDESLLVAEITPEDGEAAMPKNDEPLSGAQIELIRRWISEGAVDDSPASVGPQISMEHPPVYENLPVITSLDYSPDGKLLAVAGFHEVLLHDVSGGSDPVGRLVGLSERIQSVKFSPDGKWLAVTGGIPTVMGEVQVWDVAKRKLRVSNVLTFDTIYGASWSSDSKLLAFGCADNSVRAIEAKSGKEILFQGAHNDWVLATVFSVDSSHLVSVSRDRSMKLIQVETQQFIDNITSITPGALKGGLMTVDCHPKEDWLVVGGADGVPKIYRMHRQKARKVGDDFNLIQRFTALPGRMFAIQFHPDGSRFVAGSSYNLTGEVRAYAVGGEEFVAEAKKSDKERDNAIERRERARPEKKDGEPLWTLAVPSAIYAVAYSPDGQTVAATGFAGKVFLIDAEKGTLRSELPSVPAALISRVASRAAAAPAADKPPKKAKTRRRRL